MHMKLRWLVVGVAVGALVVAERWRPLRKAKDPGPERVGRNLVLGLLAAMTTAATQAPLVRRTQTLAERRQLGLLRVLPMPRVLRVVLGFLLLDYTLYLWHWLNHRSDLLWRFHSVHHADLDLDASTGIRFHFGELALAAAFRCAQVLLIGVDRQTLAWWQRCLFASVVFHHSNLELPEASESAIVPITVTPRMHGIHHATRPEWMNTNYSSLLSIWDRLHGTWCLDVPQGAITIGVGSMQRREDVTLERSVALPFVE
jgi:sterol desaturase/sphingolipid hydroxylase (fatty acid hydroxylase superfamily)